MTVSAQTPINRSTGNGVTTVFPYTFKILAEGDILVTVDGVTKTLTTHYTVSGVGVEGGGNVTMLVAPASGTAVTRRRNMALVRTVDYQDQGELPTDTLDDDQDAPIMMLQQVNEAVNRSMALSPDVAGVSTQLPTPEANSFLGWNALGTAIVNYLGIASAPVTTYMATVLAAANALAARAALGASTVGEAVFTAVNAAAARSAIGGAASGAVTGTGITMTTARLLGRTTAATGAVEEMTVGQGLSLVAGALTVPDTGITPAMLNGAQSGSAPIYGVRAWVNFNGTGTVAIRASGNVSSVTDNGTGDYTVNFTVAMQDANYGWAPGVGGNLASANNPYACYESSSTARTASALRISNYWVTNGQTDPSQVSVIVVR